MSHELRTPLNSIIGFAEILKAGMVGPLDAQQQRFVEDICSASKHLHSLINDVLDLAKVEAGKCVLELGECRVADLLEAAAFVLRESSMRRDIRFEVTADPTLGTACLDARKVKQVLFNLLSNAVKFSPDRSTVRLKAWSCARKDVRVSDRVPSRILPLPDAGDEEFIAFAVEDDGAGIPADQMQTLFTPFGQLKGVKSHEGEGTGLGLSLVGRLVQLHRGTVGIESEPGGGTRFLAWIPRLATPPGCVPSPGPAPDPRAPA
jgi:signal transduction histidine kinase